MVQQGKTLASVVEAIGDIPFVEKEVQRIVAERRAFRANQFRLPGNFRAHYLHTGPEFLSQSGGGIDAFCDFVGTGLFCGLCGGLQGAQCIDPLFCR